MVSMISCLASSRPPTSLQRVFVGLDEDLPHRRRLHLFQRRGEVVAVDPHLLQELARDLLVQVELRQIPSQRFHGGFLAQSRQVRAHEAVRRRRQAFQVDVLQRHAAGVDLEDLQPVPGVRDADLYLAVETSRPAQRRVDGVQPVGRADDDDLASLLEAVHHGEQLCDDAPLDLAGDLLTLGRDGVQLVDEDDRRCGVAGVLEDLAEPLFRLAVVLGHDLRPGDGVELGAALVGHGLGEQRLAGARGPVEQYALGRVDAQPLEQLRVLHGQLDHLADALDFLAQPADVLVRDAGRLVLLVAADRLVAKLDFRVLVDQRRPGRLDLDRDERDRLVGQRPAHERVGHAAHQGDDVAQDDGPLQQLVLDHFHRVAAELDGRALRRRQHDVLGVLDRGLADLDPLADAHVGVLPREAVDADHLLAPVPLLGTPDLRHRIPFAFNFYDVPRRELQLQEGVRVNARDAPAKIAGQRLCNLQI